MATTLGPNLGKSDGAACLDDTDTAAARFATTGSAAARG